MGKNNKQPKWKTAPGDNKKPKTSDAANYNNYNPSWQIRTMDKEGRWGWHKVKGGIFWQDLHPILSDFETMTWNEILVGKNKRCHPIPVNRISPEAQKKLRLIHNDDIDELISLGYSGKSRIWGIRDRNVLRLLWWDPNHEICPSEKRHT